MLNEPAEATEYSALEYVVREAEHEMKRLEDLVEELIVKEGPECPALEGLYEKIDEMDPSTFESRAAIILTGLGFNSVTIKKPKICQGLENACCISKSFICQANLVAIG